MKFYATSTLSEHIRKTPEGYLICLGVPVARVGNQVYGAEELPDVTPDERGEIVITRPEDEVFSPQSMASFEGKDVTVEHPDGGDVRPDNWRRLSCGHAQNVRRDGPLLVMDLLIKAPEAIRLVESKALREISCGYDADYEETGPGRGVQRRIRGNHIALVEAGRAGAPCSIRDHKRPQGQKEKSMSKNVKDAFRRMFLRTLDELPDEDVPGGAGDGEGATIKIKVEGPDARPVTTDEDPPAASDTETGKDADALQALIARLDKLEARLAALESKGGDKTGDEDAPDTSVEDELSACDEDAPTTDEEGVTQDEEGEESEEGGGKPGTATTDAARRALWQDALHRASILAGPGLRVPTFDSARRGTFRNALRRVKIRAVDAALATVDGERALRPWLGQARSAVRLAPEVLDAAFIGASDALARAHNAALRFGDAPRADGRMTAAALNARNQKFWQDRQGSRP